MSQFLICKSKKAFFPFGIKYEKCEANIDLYKKVVNLYLKEETENIWVIEEMCEWINDMSQNISKIEYIAQNSEIMIMWYGADFSDLDIIYSYTDFIDHIRKELNNPFVELYLFYKAR